MAAAVLEINENQLELVCDECDYYGATDTIFIDNSTQTDGYDDDESELKPLKPRLSQIVEEEAEMEGAVKDEVDTQVETNGIQSDSNGVSDVKTAINGNESIVAEEISEEEPPVEASVPHVVQELVDSDDEVEIDDVTRLAGLTLGMGYARIIDYDNLRIIEHVIESDDEDDKNVAAAGTAATSAELQQACHDLVTFIGESYQVIERSGHSREPTATLSVVDNNNNNRSSEVSTNGRGAITDRSKSTRKVHNGLQVNQKFK